MKASQKLAKARRNIELHGWARGYMGDYDTGFCAVGAFMPEINPLRGIVRNRKAFKYLAKAAGLSHWTGIPDWNDGVFTSKGEVLMAFRIAEKLALEDEDARSGNSVHPPERGPQDRHSRAA